MYNFLIHFLKGLKNVAMAQKTNNVVITRNLWERQE